MERLGGAVAVAGRVTVFDDLLSEIRGTVGYLANEADGNWGDRLIDRGTMNLLTRAGIDVRRIPYHVSLRPNDFIGCDTILFFGSGSVGACCPGYGQARDLIRRAVPGAKTILLPSTALDTQDHCRACDIVYAREGVSREMLGAVHPDV